MQKLIILYGFAASGKTTLAKKYIDNHPLVIAVEFDQIIGMIGQWRRYEDEARKLVFEHTKSIIKNHLSAGHDVLLPYLLTDHEHANEFEAFTKHSSISFYEIYLDIEREDAIERLLTRGVWGEEGSPQLTTADLPEINSLYETMEKAMSVRKGVRRINSDLEDVLGTYEKFLEVISHD